MGGFGLRLSVGAAIVVLGAAAVALVVGSAEAALLALVAGIAAVIAAATFDTDAPRAEPARRAPEASVAEVLDAVDEPVLLARAGQVVRANAAATRLLGEHVLGEDVRTAIRHPAAAALLDTAATDAGRTDLAGLGGIDQHWEMHVAATTDGARVIHLADRTRSHAAERTRVDFVANASHELRTPLASILGYVETLGEEAGEDPDVRQRFLKIMFDEARRMQRLVDDLISLSRIEAEKYRPPARRVDLAELADTVRDELAYNHAARGRDIVLTLAPDLPSVTGDEAQLSQVLHNLVSNAMKYGRAGTPIAVTLARTDGSVRLVVADEGEGIAPEHLPRLTERFYRADAGRSRALGGTGLGLAIVKHIVERHRGRLDIASEVGRGTTVTITLPATAAPDAVTKA